MDSNPLDPLKVFIGGLRPGIAKWQIQDFLESQGYADFLEIYVRNNDRAGCDDIAFIRVQKPAHSQSLIELFEGSVDGLITDVTVEAAV